MSLAQTERGYPCACGTGRALTSVETLFKDTATATGVNVLRGVFAKLSGHISGAAKLTGSSMSAQLNTFQAYEKLLIHSETAIRDGFDLVDAFEGSTHGPLFMTSATANGFPRVGLDGDVHQLSRTMLAVQQGLMDQVYTTGVVAACSKGLFQGRRWRTATFYPGTGTHVSPPSNKVVVHTVKIDGTVPKYWGIPMAFAEDDERRPTGFYLSPGELATVTVPQGMVHAGGFSVLVGCNTVDNSNKGTHRRMDRTTATFKITSPSTVIANPLGGNIYIQVPYLAGLGVISIKISGGVVKAPLFQLTHFKNTSGAEWDQVRTAPGAWADFETDMFLMQVPRSWVFAKSNPSQLMLDYDTAMTASFEFRGIPVEKKSRKMLYLQPDLHIRHGAYGIGYPQVNTLYNSQTTYSGDHNHWLVRQPERDAICYHELGHSLQFDDSQYRGEVEAMNNLLHAYIRNTKFGVDFDQAFDESFGGSNYGYTVDQACVHWMITPNFRNGKEMDHSNTEHDEFRYQHRGYGKYADIARLFGWQAFTGFFYKANAKFELDGTMPRHGLSQTDSRTLRFSLHVGVDLTPLVHFWGIPPDSADDLKAKMVENGLVVSSKVHTQLLKYVALIPRNSAEFNDFFEDVYPGRPTGGPSPLYVKYKL